MKNIQTIVKKELLRFFSDKRMIFSVIIMPGLMLYLLYSVIGNGIGTMEAVNEDYTYSVAVENLPQQLTGILPFDNIEQTDGTYNQQMISQIQNQEYDMLVIFPDDFKLTVMENNSAGETEVPNIKVYYNSTKKGSLQAYNLFVDTMNQYEESIANVFEINGDDGEVYDLATDEDNAAYMLSMIMPMLMIAFLFSGGMAVAPESIAGEKEKGTLAPLLVSPIKRSQLALGKIIGLSVLAVCSGLSSFIGITMALPNYLAAIYGEFDAQVYKASDYLILLIIIFATVMLIISLISIISAFSRSVKEANSYIAPFLLLSMMLGMTSMFTEKAVENPCFYFIPIYNSVQCFNALFGMNTQFISVAITVAANLVYALILIYVLKRMFESEKIMFSK